MPEAEVLERITLCARILDAWPNARPLNRDRTLIEYVNATRGVELRNLPRFIQLAIDAGGDFMPPAGEIVRRAAAEGLGGKPVGTDRDALFWHDKNVREIVEQQRRRADLIAPLNPDGALPAGHEPPRLGDGR